MVLPAGLRKPEEAERLVQRATRAWGQIDVLVNNAGIITVGPVENQTVEDFREVMNTNFFSALHCALAVMPQMLARGNGTSLMRTGSHLNALFSGDAKREYRWFSLGAATPAVSTGAQSAARKIVRAVIARKTEIAITPQAMLASKLAPLSPGLTSRMMSGMSRMLPASRDQKTAPVRGMDVRDLETAPAKRLGWRAARRYNEVGGRA